MEAFSADWARVWCRALNGDPAFRAAAGGWAGDVTLVMTESSASEAPRRAVRVEIHDGACHTAEPAADADLTEASYVLTATGKAWGEILSGRQNPLTALLTGKLRLARGNLAALLPYGAMARELIRLAVAMNASIPDGWG